MASLPTAGFLLSLVAIVAFCVSCNGKEISRYYITPDPETSCGEDHEPCLTLDQFASGNLSSSSATLILIPGQHNLTESFEVVGVGNFSILANTSVTIQCTSPASFLFEGISNLEIRNTAIVSCGGGGSSGAVQVKSVKQFDFSNVTLQESASISLNVQDSNGLVTGARFIGNTGAGMKTTNSTVVLEGNNTFSDNLDGGIASYNSTLQFIGVNQFTNNTATSGGGISAISSTINCSGNMTFEYNSVEQDGGGVYASGTRMTCEGEIKFVGNTVITVRNYYDYSVYYGGDRYIDNGGAGLFAGHNSKIDFRGTISFVKNHVIFGSSTFCDYYICHSGGGIYAATSSTVYINGTSSFIGNSARNGGGVYAWDATVDISGTNNFANNSAQYGGGGVYARNATVDIRGTNNFIDNSAQLDGGGVCAWNDATVYIRGTNNFIDNSAQWDGGGVYAGDATVTISETNNFINNSAQEDGGGVFASYYATVYICGTNNFTGNLAQGNGGGGGVFAWFGAIVNISGSNNFIDNSAQRDGGGVHAYYATVDISGTNNFIHNSAQQYGGGGGVYAYYATVDISGTNNFIHNSAQQWGGGVFAYHYATVDISGTNNFINNSAQEDGGGVYAYRNATVDISGTNNFTGNSAQRWGGGVYAHDYATVNISGTNNFTNNSAQVDGGGLCARNRAIVNISGTNNFIDNSAQENGGGVYAGVHATVDISGTNTFASNSAQTGTGGAVSLYESAVVHISGNSSFTRNSASVRGGGMYVDTGGRAYFNGRSLFSDNWSQYGGGISLQRSEIMLLGNTAFSNNNASYGGAIQAIEANINVTENVDFTKNRATVNGGALALDGDSVVYIFEKVLLTFVENRAASFGGAIYIEDNSVHCSYHWRNINGFIGIYDLHEYYCWKADSDLPSCFHRFANSFRDKINLAFSGNSATAGSAIFGGEIDEALTNIMFHFSGNTVDTTVGDLFQYLFSDSINESNAQPTISSNPNRICGCVNGQPDFSDPLSPYEVTVYPGQTVAVSLVAVGQRNGTVPSTTTAQYDPDNGATFGDLQSIQRIDHTTCMELNYTIFSRKQTETVKIYVDNSCGLEGTPLSVNVTVLECPIGFTLSNLSNQCVCEERLQKYTNSCDINNLEITRTASEDFWVGVDNTNGTEGLILHPHCPFDYCTTDTVNFTLVEGNDVSLTDTHTASNASLNNTNHSMNDTNHSTSTFVTVLNDTDTLTIATVNDTDATDYAIGRSIDAQCNYNRSGLLCGKCQKGFSLVFGSSKCLKCSNSYLSLLIAFALAGIVLVVFLLTLKLTVAVGTINGLIFYANIVSVNRAQLFPSGETNVLTMFIAWVNLDLGIETCFFDGMDAYSKAWLQYAFPVYVWILVGAIILASRHSTRIVRSLGNNPVAVLATLFLLSYAKLLRSIINPLFFTFLEYPSDTKEVWLVDGNIPYLKGKHIPLFLTSLLALFLLFIPFTLLLLLGQWIQAQSERKCFKWISDYRVNTFLDVYHGPFKNKHRYWSGLLLVTRFCLFLVFAFNVNGDTSVNILAITVCLIGLLAIIFQFNIYKAWYLNVLEASFIINLLLLAIGTYYVEISEGNQSALTYTSVSVAFATFCGIVVYHFCLQVKDTMVFKKLYKKFFTPADDTGAGDIEMKEIEEDPPRKYTRPPTTSVVEITH